MVVILDFELILWPLFKDKGVLRKLDVDNCKDLPSYNTCNRKGLILDNLNKKFRLRTYLEKPNFCLNCEKPLEYPQRDNRYCSSSCSAKVNNKLKKSKIPNRFCNYCKGLIITKGRNLKFCCQTCHKKQTYLDDFLDWYLFALKFSNRAIRKFLTDYIGNHCSICKITTWNGSAITFEVEHIDGNSENCSKENVCLICPNCHSQTLTYKGKNKGNGRHIRMLRYREGKSY